MITVDAPAAVAAIMARVTELSAEPPEVAALRGRFSALIAGQPTVAPSTSTNSTTSSVSTSSTPALSMRTEGAMQAPQILRGAYSVDSASGATDNVPAAMPTGVWVDRIPNARGKALAPAIDAAAQRYGLDPAFLAAVFWTESSYTPDAVSRTGAIGLGQLMPETAQWLGVDPWDPMQNIDGSARFYRQLIDNNHGDMSLAIASYAAGPGAVKRAGGIPDQFTADYVTKLLARTDYLNGRRSTAP
ncbi:MAG: lytic transglycosylase domain-containing protein [Ilumatobacteraceae bacterium]